MGNLNCSNCRSKDDLLEEIKSDSSSQNGHRSGLASNDLVVLMILNQKNFRILILIIL